MTKGFGRDPALVASPSSPASRSRPIGIDPAQGEKVAAKLDKARALIEAGWCREDYARSAKGNPVTIYSRAASCFCASGAIRRVTKEGPLEAAVGYTFAEILGINGRFAIPKWNDAPERTQAEVIDAFKRAAALARGEQVSHD